MKEGVRKDTQVTNTPSVQWFYADDQREKIFILFENNPFQIQGKTHTQVLL